ncbi:MAG: glutathione S-transferase family protein [Xenococcaceae cyanobacterium MO_188.B32]|nr:glutathione S-transferase family protein [Xenococcaceae cyanobacterium MO_188.B32]
MLTLYYARPSGYSRPVWLALLEKKLPFKLVHLKMDGDQFSSEFSQISPFNRIPVLVDNNLPIIESVTILDYLEAKYPSPSFLPNDAETLAKVRMVQMIGLNELFPATIGLLIHQNNPSELEYAQQRVIRVLALLEDLLGDNPYFAGEQLTLAEIVTGTLVPELPRFDISLTNYPKLSNWGEKLLARESWQQIRLSDKEFTDFKRRLRVWQKIWQKRRRQKILSFARQNQIKS